MAISVRSSCVSGFSPRRLFGRVSTFLPAHPIVFCPKGTGQGPDPAKTFDFFTKSENHVSPVPF